MNWTFFNIAILSFITNVLCEQGYKYPAPSQPFNGGSTQSPGQFPSDGSENYPSPTPGGYPSSPSEGFPSPTPGEYPTPSIGGYPAFNPSSPGAYPGTSAVYQSPTPSGYPSTTPGREYAPSNGQYPSSPYPGITPEKPSNGFSLNSKPGTYPQGPNGGYPSTTGFPISSEPTVTPSKRKTSIFLNPNNLTQMQTIGYPASGPGFTQDIGKPIDLVRPSPTPNPVSQGSQTNYPGSNNYQNGQSVSNTFPGSNGQVSQNFGSGPSALGSNGDENVEEGDLSAIPGQPDIDYPILASIPETSFRCEQQEHPGYYADVETRCQVFHVCSNNKTYDFLCPNGTIFHQEYFVCVWWNQFDCNSAPSLFGLNANIYDYSITGTGAFGNGAYPVSGVGPTTPETQGSNGLYQRPQGFKSEINSSGYPNYSGYPTGGNQGVQPGSSSGYQNNKPVGPPAPSQTESSTNNQGYDPTDNRGYQPGRPAEAQGYPTEPTGNAGYQSGRPFDNQKFSTGTVTGSQEYQLGNNGISFQPTSPTGHSYPGHSPHGPSSSQRPFDNTIIPGQFPSSSSTSRPGYLPPRPGQSLGANQKNQQNYGNYHGQYPTTQHSSNGYPNSQGPTQIPTRDYLPPVRK